MAILPDPRYDPAHDRAQCAPPPPTEQVERYCWRSPWAVLREQPLTSPLDPRVLAGGLVFVMAICYVVFA